MQFSWKIRSAILISLLICVCISTACELNQTHYGCRIDNGQCTCAHGCKSEFRYLTRKECQDALKGRITNICSHPKNPCYNNGICIQVSYSPGYKCKCLNGHFGNRCQRKCPTPGSVEAAQAVPAWECAESLI